MNCCCRGTGESFGNFARISALASRTVVSRDRKIVGVAVRQVIYNVRGRGRTAGQPDIHRLSIGDAYASVINLISGQVSEGRAVHIGGRHIPAKGRGPCLGG